MAGSFARSASSAPGSWAPGSPRSPPAPVTTSSWPRDRDARQTAWCASIDVGLAKAVERGKATVDERDADHGADHRHRGLRLVGRLRPRDRVGDRGHRRQEGAVRRRSIERVKPSAILATNTSTLAGDRPGAWRRSGPSRSAASTSSTRRPAMTLVEVVRPLTASDETIADAMAFADVVRQGPGRGGGPCRLHRQRAAVPVPQQRGAHVRARHGVA